MNCNFACVIFIKDFKNLLVLGPIEIELVLLLNLWLLLIFCQVASGFTISILVFIVYKTWSNVYTFHFQFYYLQVDLNSIDGICFLQPKIMIS